MTLPRVRLGVLLGLAIAAAAVRFAWGLGDQAPGLDFYQFWAGAQVARTTAGGNLYSPETRSSAHEAFLRRGYAESRNMMLVGRARQEFEFFSTPFLYTTFGLFPGKNYDRDLFAYRVVTLCAFAAGVLLACRAVGLSWTASLFLLAFTLTLFQPLKAEIRVANVNSLQLFGIGAAMFLGRSNERWRWFASGAVLALVAMFKPNVAVIVPLLLAHRFIARERARLVVEAVGVGAGVIATFAVSSVYFGGATSWMDWFAAARNLAATLLPLEYGNVAPALAIARSLGANATLVVTGVLSLVVLGAVYRSRKSDGAAIIGIGLLIYLLAATLVWLHYLVLALPLVVVLIADSQIVRRVLGVLFLTLIGGDVWTQLLNIRTPGGEARILWLGLGMALLATLWRLASQHGSEPRPSESAARERATSRKSRR
jgi:hypothetical protein